MSIKVNTRWGVFVLNIGYKTPWFGQMSFITIIKEEYENMGVYNAYMIFRS